MCWAHHVSLDVLRLLSSGVFPITIQAWNRFGGELFKNFLTTPESWIRRWSWRSTTGAINFETIVYSIRVYMKKTFTLCVGANDADAHVVGSLPNHPMMAPRSCDCCLQVLLAWTGVWKPDCWLHSYTFITFSSRRNNNHNHSFVFSVCRTILHSAAGSGSRGRRCHSCWFSSNLCYKVCQTLWYTKTCRSFRCIYWKNFFQVVDLVCGQLRVSSNEFTPMGLSCAYLSLRLLQCFHGSHQSKWWLWSSGWSGEKVWSVHTEDFYQALWLA